MQPTESISDEFKNDCLIWMLLQGKNLTASANDLEWNNQTWSIVNHFIPFTESEVNAPARFESDFMVQYLAGLPPLPNPPPRRGEGVISLSLDGSEANLTASDGGTKRATSLSLDGRGIEGEGAIYKSLSAEASAVRLAGQVLWQAYFANTDVRNVRDEFKLNRPDVGWYQIHNALKARNASGDFTPVSFAEFEAAYKTLGDKLRPQVYELGFLR